MNLIRILILISIILLSYSCSQEPTNKTVIKEKSLDLQVLEAYNVGKKNLEAGDVLYAAKKFNEAEILFPQSDWAPKSALMAAYSYYIQDYYGDAEAELLRFKKVYPNHKNIDYADYLLAICYYEQIVDEKKDTQSIIKAKNDFKLIIKNYPNSDYAIDAEFKINLIDDILAAKEMYVARYYVDKKKWIAAINRFRKVVDDYETTIYTEEALHRLVEIYYNIGLTNEAKKYAKLLGYNYQSSEWYEKSYSILNKNYEKQTFNKQKKNSMFKKVKSLFE